MSRKLCVTAAWYSLLFLIISGSPGFAADPDESLIERLETATDAREKDVMLDEIQARTAQGPLSVNLTDRLISELMTDERYGYHYLMQTLPQLAGEQGYSEQSLITLAEGLSGPLVQKYSPAKAISETLSAVHSTDGLPDAAFSALILALDHIAMLNRSAAVEVLAATAQEDSRHSAAMTAVLEALNSNDHQHTRSSAIAALKRLTTGPNLPQNVIDVLVEKATTDPYMTVRMDALELLASRNIEDSLSRKLSESLATELITPNHELWGRTSGLREHKSLNDRATQVLADLHEAPYPGHVIAAWTAQSASYEPDKSLEALRPVYERGELTADQIEVIVQVAARHRRASEREKVYAMLFVELQAAALMDALIGLESADDEASRIRSGYALKNQYRESEVPDRVADVAARVSLAGSSAELRALAAGLLSRTYRDREKRESQLIAALARHPDDNDIHTAIIDLYGPERLEELLIEYASDADLSVTFRRRIINDLGRQTVTGAGLSPGAENTLKEVARNADDYYLVQYAGDTLNAWGVQAPLRVALRNRENQSRTLFSILVALLVINLIAAITAVIGVFKYPLEIQEKGKRTIARTAMFSAWLVMTIGILVLLAAGGVGFLGHNSAPKPTATLLWNLPAYAGTVVYVFLTWFLWRQAKKAPA